MVPCKTLMIGLLLGLAYHSSVAAEPDVSSSDRSVGWPQYKRNSERTGNSPLEILTFPLHRISAIRFPAPIYASPAVSHGRAYIQDALGHVACVDSKQNKLHWLTKIDGMKNTSSPALAHHNVYIG